MSNIEIYSEAKHTEIYKVWYNEVSKLQAEFEKNPCKKTATNLSNVKNRNLSQTEKYNSNELYQISKRETEARMRILGYVNTIKHMETFFGE